MKKVTDDIMHAFERSVEALSLNELSRQTGVRITTLRRFLNRRGNYIKQETFDKLYPALAPFLQLKAADPAEKPQRIGAEPRMGHYLDDLVSDEKILIDVYDALEEYDRKKTLAEFQTAVPSAVALAIPEFSTDENCLLGCYRAMKPEQRDPMLLELVQLGTGLMRERRKGV